MPDFNFTLPSQTMLGPGTVNWAGTAAASLGDRVVLLADPILNDLKVVSRVTESLKSKGIEPIVFDDIRAVASSSTVDEVTRLARGARTNLVIGLGGINVQAVARAVALLAPNGMSASDLIDGGVPENEPLPFMEILSTCRDPFLFRDEALMVDSRNRSTRIIRTGRRVTSVVIADPDLAANLQGKMPALIVMDTLLSAVEGFLSTRCDFLADALLERAIAMLAKSLTAMTSNPLDAPARNTAFEGGFLTAMGLSISSMGLGTALTYALNGRYRLLKPPLAAIFLPYVLEAAVKSSVEKTARIAAAFGEDTLGLTPTEAAEKAAESIRIRIGALRIPNRLKEFGLSIDELVDVAAVVRRFDLINYLPRAVSVDDVYDVIKQAF